MAWGVALTLFFAVFFPVYWIYEIGRLEGATQEVGQFIATNPLYFAATNALAAGPLTDDELEDVKNFILANQVDETQSEPEETA
ncbi:MAG: hypothetical protein BRC31_00105, partial [Actinobacteria bacterium QS_5_72_10]